MAAIIHAICVACGDKHAFFSADDDFILHPNAQYEYECPESRHVTLVNFGDRLGQAVEYPPQGAVAIWLVASPDAAGIAPGEMRQPIAPPNFRSFVRSRSEQPRRF